MAQTGRPRQFDEDRVVDAAKEVFWERGYGATSVQVLVDELGLQRASIYGTFGDKHALFLRGLQRYADDVQAVAATLLEPGAVLPRVQTLLLGVLTAAREHPGRGCLAGNTAAELLPEDTDAAAIVAGTMRHLEAVLARALAAGQAQGEVRPDLDPGAHARLLVALVQGLHVLARTERDPRRLEDAVEAALAPLRRELRPVG